MFAHAWDDTSACAIVLATTHALLAVISGIGRDMGDTASMSLTVPHLPCLGGLTPLHCCVYNQAIAISEHVLGGRSPEATEKFEKRLMARSEGGLTGNDMSYFWSPAQGDSLEAEVARNGPMAKIIFHDFMTLLCTEAERLESNMLDLLPQLFREMDTSHNGHLTRCGGLRRDIWSCCSCMSGPYRASLTARCLSFKWGLLQQAGFQFHAGRVLQ